MLDKFKEALNRLKSTNASEDQVHAAVAKIVNSRILGLVISLTGNKVDDAVLESLRAVFPKN